ncbi:hypothetical protein [Algirhabdus cladophorae]|uniref:hypothetical protein n=1 Tax=Algirhabdus cladophorae TaxID=3377108 RepID=UPI003B84B659
MKALPRLSKCLATILALQFAAGIAWAQVGTGTHNLDGTEVNWTYNNNDAQMIVSFAGGLAEYEWIAGAPKGNSDSEIPYSSREIAPNVYLMSWVQDGRPDYITMIFNFNDMTIATTGVLRPGTDEERRLFLDGVINSVDR